MRNSSIWGLIKVLGGKGEVGKMKFGKEKRGNIWNPNLKFSSVFWVHKEKSRCSNEGFEVIVDFKKKKKRERMKVGVYKWETRDKARERRGGSSSRQLFFIVLLHAPSIFLVRDPHARLSSASLTSRGFKRSDFLSCVRLAPLHKSPAALLSSLQK